MDDGRFEQETSAPGPKPPPPAQGTQGGGRVTRLLHAVIELVEVEAELIALRCSRIARDAITRLCLLALAGAAFLVAVVFLYVGIFRLLTHWLLPWQVCGIFAAAHLAMGGAILLACRSCSSSKGNRRSKQHDA